MLCNFLVEERSIEGQLFSWHEGISLGGAIRCGLAVGLRDTSPSGCSILVGAKGGPGMRGSTAGAGTSSLTGASGTSGVVSSAKISVVTSLSASSASSMTLHTGSSAEVKLNIAHILSHTCSGAVLSIEGRGTDVACSADGLGRNDVLEWLVVFEWSYN